MCKWGGGEGVEGEEGEKRKGKGSRMNKGRK